MPIGGAAQARVFFPAGRETVFDYLADPTNRPQWQSSLRSVELLDGGPPRAGARWVDRTAVGISFRLAIVELRRPEWWVEEGSSGPFRVRVELSFSSAEPSSRPRTSHPGTWVACTVRVHAERWARPLGWGVGRAGRLAARADLRRAARLLAGR